METITYDPGADSEDELIPLNDEVRLGQVLDRLIPAVTAHVRGTMAPSSTSIHRMTARVAAQAILEAARAYVTRHYSHLNQVDQDALIGEAVDALAQDVLQQCAGDQIPVTFVRNRVAAFYARKAGEETKI